MALRVVSLDAVCSLSEGGGLEYRPRSKKTRAELEDDKSMDYFASLKFNLQTKFVTNSVLTSTGHKTPIPPKLRPALPTTNLFPCPPRQGLSASSAAVFTDPWNVAVTLLSSISRLETVSL